MQYTRLPADFIDRLRDLLCTVRTEQLFMRSSREEDRLQRIVQLAVNQTDAAVGLLLLVNEDRGDLQVAAAVGDAVTSLPATSLVGRFIPHTGLTAFAIDEGNPIAIADRPQPTGSDATGTDVHGDSNLRDHVDELTGLQTRSLLAVPLFVHGQACGALELRNAPEAQGFKPADVELTTELAYLAAAAVEEYRGDRFLFSLFSSALPYALDADRGHEGDELADELQRWLAELRQSPAWRRQVELASKVRSLCSHGNDAVTLTRSVLDALLEHEQRRISPLDR